MKTLPLVASARAFGGLIGLLTLLIAAHVSAQNSGESGDSVPVVTLHAPDPNASEWGNPGVFTIFRAGNTNPTLNVFFRIGGTASNGVDYATLPHWVMIPAGERTARIEVSPIDDSLPEGPESVHLELYYPPLGAPINFHIGSPSNATVVIADNDGPNNTNLQSVVTVRAIDEWASEPGVLAVVDFGLFRIFRTGPTNEPMRVFYSLGGTASNGVDYFELPGHVEIPAGAHSADVAVFAKDDELSEGVETVVLKIKPPVCIAIDPPPPGCYRVGEPDHAVVFIRDNDHAPPPPVVSIVAVDPFACEVMNCGMTNTVADHNGPVLTNHVCATNTATFLVRRAGSTNASLTVHYSIGGTASNGVDYAEIPAAVTIPAGHRAARVVIKPIPDNLPEKCETVVLALRLPASTTSNTPPYLIGWPRKAGAVIVDDCRLRPHIGRLPCGSFHAWFPATNGFLHHVEVSTDLIHWTPICTGEVEDGAVHFVDPESGDQPARFYRVIPAEELPEE